MPKLPLPVPGIPLSVFFQRMGALPASMSVLHACPLCFYITYVLLPQVFPHYNDLFLISWCLHKWQNQGPCLKRALKVSLGTRTSRHGGQPDTRISIVFLLLPDSERHKFSARLTDLGQGRFVQDPEHGFHFPTPSDLFLKLLGVRQTQALGTYELDVWFGTS